MLSKDVPGSVPVQIGRNAASKSPSAQGLYSPENEHDACGVSFVAQMDGTRSHRLVAQAISSLCNLEHRGATGAEVNTGDGAGILIQVPDRFLRDVVDFELPAPGHYAVGLAFLPSSTADTDGAAEAVDKIVDSEGLTVLGWRDVPIDPVGADIGYSALGVMPVFRQIFIGSHEGLAGLDLDRRVFVARKRIEHELRDDNGDPLVYFSSLSSRTLVYKGMLTTPQLAPFFPDLTDPRVESAIALVHSRFSTNTFPSWPLAHPYRFVAHNGEINTVQGNQNWMRAREAMIRSPHFGEGDISRVFPICTPGASDTARFDEALELLHLGGYDLPHAVLMMIPEAWENHADMSPERRAFYRYHSCLMEPWDGPASVVFTDGTLVGAVLDRNGLRPSRYWVTEDGLVVMASEVGTLDIDPATVVHKGRLQPGKMFLIDTAQGRIVGDQEIKDQLATALPYQQWLDDNLVHLDDLPDVIHITESELETRREQQTFGYTHEELKLIVDPMARTGYEALGSMGTDTPIAVLSNRPRLMFDYFAQLFAQVTNPPLDAIREELVTSIGTSIGPEGNLFDEEPEQCHQLGLTKPILTNRDLAKVRGIDQGKLRATTLPMLFDVRGGGEALTRAMRELCAAAEKAIDDGWSILILSD
ncbi:MAG TPA: glutamate synthase central domain-containing protein, partial [Microthrixaceae bacterium]|nr:glutamate synthase central domain-containing protein [Microthrixaceae bacterium]